jgi:hypothetical protein
MIRRSLIALPLLLAVLPLEASAQRPPGGPNLSELLDRPAFRASYDALFKSERNVDDWIRDYTRTKDGPATPSNVIDVNGRPHIGAGVCKRHDCGNNQLRLLFSQDGGRVTGMLISPRGQRWFGNPTSAEKSALLAVSSL